MGHTQPPAAPPPPTRARLLEVAGLFLRLGFTAFGGPAAHIALYHDEVVRRRKWLDEQHFIDLLGAVNLIPGPNSTEMAIHIGYTQAGWPGLLTAGACFILPSTAMVLGLAYLYQRYGALPETAALMYGISPVIIAIILQALLGLSKKMLRSPLEAGLAAGTLALYLLNAPPIPLMLGAALLMLAVRRLPRPFTPPPGGWLLAGLSGLAAPGGLSSAAQAAGFSLLTLFLTFLKIGGVLYGSGYVLLAFLQADFVDRLGWLTSQQVLDAIAVGQVTPGPVFNSAAFIGYLLGGLPGGLLATLGIFLPSFVFVAISNPLIPRLRRSPIAAALLDGVNLASLGLMAGVALELGRKTLVDLPSIAILALSLLLLRWRVNTTWLIAGGALVGLAVMLLR
ncbi:MAG: chromate efflux transporter [Chloroflexota bacterium]